MKIKQIRQGFANNSSSTHSIIYSNKPISSEDSDYGFGWDYFTAADKESKERYMFASLIGNINEETLSNIQFYGDRNIGKSEEVNFKNLPYVVKNGKKFVLHFGWYKKYNERFEHIVKPFLKLYSDCFENFDHILESYESNPDSFSVDHQSRMFFPKDSKTGLIHHKFAKDLIKFVVNENFAILGGNDNSDGEHPYESYNEGHELLGFLHGLVESSGLVVVRDEANEDYVVQNQRSGTVYRISFTNEEETRKSSIPTLVDISITSYCDKGCKFCYQSSTIKGTHANKNDVFNVLSSLKAAGTLEIVLGGGEPTSHPDFVEILKYAKNIGFVVSFTTRNYNLDSNPDINYILSNTHSIAFSCNNETDVQSVIEYRNRLVARQIWPHPNMTVQNILGLDDLDGLTKFLDKCASEYYTENVCLLGYKDFGFGKNHSSKNVDGWIDLIKSYTNSEHDNILSFGIDSIVVKKYKESLISAGVDYRTLVAEEGKFSCYIDCVKNTIASSSFTNISHEFNENWLKTYQTF